ncbi:MAG: DUF2207 family protein [Bacilli bacterium]
MKKKILLFLMMMLFMPLSVLADTIYSVSMNVNILEDGTANIVEKWDVKADSGSEWHKTMYELNNSKLTNYKVLVDGEELEYKEWDVDESLSEKSGYYGINNTYDGIELCFGKGDFKRHTFTVSYTLSNYVFNTDDSQVLAWVLFPKANVGYFTAEISSYYKFPDTLDVWGYGYKGYAYVEDGVIRLSTEESLINEYVSLLVKFPLNTFKTDNVDSRYKTFNDVYEVAEEGTFDYDYGTDNSGNNNSSSWFDIFMYTICLFFPFLIIIFGVKTAVNSGYGYINNKKIDKKNTPMFREIPCNKDIYYANALIKLNDFGYKESNIFGAIILKWVKENKIGFKNEKTGIFNKETSVIDLTMNPQFDNDCERKLFNMMYEASGDGILETKEFEKWCRNNYSEFFDLFEKIENKKISELKSEGHIYKRVNKDECQKKNVMDDKIYQDSTQLYGLKLYLEEFAKMDTKEVMEVHLWDEYLMFAYLFGIADKVAKQLKNMYPEIMEQQDFNYDTIIFVNQISTRSVSAASSARSAAESYSSGGGGFSSGGGGGFSGGFSGGGGGSAGGR